MFDAYLAPIHGGSIIGFVTHAGTRPVSERLQAMRAEEDTGADAAHIARAYTIAREAYQMRDLWVKIVVSLTPTSTLDSEAPTPTATSPTATPTD